MYLSLGLEDRELDEEIKGRPFQFMVFEAHRYARFRDWRFKDPCRMQRPEVIEASLKDKVQKIRRLSTTNKRKVNSDLDYQYLTLIFILLIAFISISCILYKSCLSPYL